MIFVAFIQMIWLDTDEIMFGLIVLGSFFGAIGISHVLQKAKMIDRSIATELAFLFIFGSNAWTLVYRSLVAAELL